MAKHILHPHHDEERPYEIPFLKIRNKAFPW